MGAAKPMQELLEQAMKDSTLQACLQRATRRVNWMPDPSSWMWLNSEGQRQGFGESWLAEPGLANLLWLVLDLAAPPQQYEARRNRYYVALALGPRKHMQPVIDLAESVNLWDFRYQFQDEKYKNFHALYPDLSQALVTLARGRVECGR